MNLRLAVGKIVCHPRVGKMIGAHYRGVVPSRGLHIDVVSPAVASENIASIFWGLYERTEVMCVQRYLPTNVDVVELGASLGVVSAHVARRLDAGAKLVCVEANPALIELIERNVRLNSAQRPLVTMNAAVSHSGPEVLFRVEDNNLGSALATKCGEKVVRVPAVTLRQIADRNTLARFTLVSDIEGAEYDLLLKEGGLIRERCDTLIIELHEIQDIGRSVSVSDLAMMIRDLGFNQLFRRNNVFVFKSMSLGS